MILQAAGLAILIISGGSVVTWAAIVVFGLGMGGVGALTPLVITDMFGLRQFGSIMGLTQNASHHSGLCRSHYGGNDLRFYG